MNDSYSTVAPLQLTLNPSWLSFFLVIVPHLVALLIVILLTGLAAGLMLLLCLLILVSLIYFSLLHLKKSLTKSVNWLGQKTDGQWQIRIAGNRHKRELIPVNLLGSTFISPFLVIINAADQEGRRYSILIPLDSLDKESFRRLRTRLRVTKPFNS